MKTFKQSVVRVGAIAGLIAGLAILVLLGAPTINKTFASTSTSTSQTINLTVNEVITLTLSTSTLSLPSLTPGTPVSATSSATVTTNSASGWNLQVNRVNTSSTITSSTYTFPDQTAFTGTNATTSANLLSGGQVLSFREALAGTSAGDYNTATWGANDAGAAMYAGFPTSAVTYASTSSYVGSAQTVVMQLRADAPATQVATNYSGSIVITAIALP
jgi:hypothetical protein